MPSFVRSVRCGAIAGLLLMAIPHVTRAQAAARSSGPVSGTWAGEASSGGLGDVQTSSAALLRFISPQTALVGQFGFSRFESGGGTFGGSGSLTSTALQVGVRRYARTGLGLRPVYGAGLLLNTSDFSGGGSSTTRAGVYGEAGAAWFFNPHVSMGVLGGLSVLNGNGNTSVAGSLARITAAVYF
jgi:hypothetical protein